MKLVVLAIACLFAIASAQTVNTIASCTSLGVVIDDFRVHSGTFQLLQTLLNGTATVSSVNPITGASESWMYNAASYPITTGAPQNILGGFRDVIVYVQNVAGQAAPGLGARININSGPLANGTIVPELEYSTDANIRSIGELQWDGNSDQTTPATFVKTGLGGVNLAAIADSFQVTLATTDHPALFRVEAWSYAGGIAANSQGVYFSWDPSTVSEQVFAFSQFQPISGSVDPISVFSNLGAMRMFMTAQSNDTAPEIDLTIYSIGFVRRYCLYKAVAPNPAAFSTSTDLFTLFFGSNSSILSPVCSSSSPLHVGDRVSFFLQAYSEGVSARVYDVKDTLPAGLTLIPGSVVTYTHGVSGVTASVVSTSGNAIDVQISVPAGLTTGATVSVFFDATIAPISGQTCQAMYSNRAYLTFPSSSVAAIASSNYNSSGVYNSSATVFCVLGTVSLTLNQTIDNTNLACGDTFTITNYIQNTGSVAASGSYLTLEFLNCSATLLNSGWTAVSGSMYQMSLGDLAPSSSPVPIATRLQAGCSCDTVTIRMCVTNVPAGASPDVCHMSQCQTVTVHVSLYSNMRICKRGELIRRLFFTIDVFNCGTGDADSVVVYETIPAGAVLNAQLSDARWSCDASGACTLTIPTLDAGVVQCVEFVLDVMDNTSVCTSWNNTARVAVLSNDTIESNTGDNSASVVIEQMHCPLPPLPECPRCCACPAPESPPAMCPCPTNTCDQCWEAGSGSCGGSDDCSSGLTQINLDFSGETATCA